MKRGGKSKGKKEKPTAGNDVCKMCRSIKSSVQKNVC